jgi:hypothetical protein
VRAEGSFAYTWNDYVPTMSRALTVSFPKDLRLYAVNQRFPPTYQPGDTIDGPNHLLNFSFPASTPATLTQETFSPSRTDLAPFTGFTLNKTWEETVLPYRKRVQTLLNSEPKAINDQLAEALGNTTLALTDRMTKLKTAIHQKVGYVDTGLPVYLNPDRSMNDILESGKGSSHDLAMPFSCALKEMKLNPQIYLYRKAGSGNLVGDLPALAQLDGVLVAVEGPGKTLLWIDPTEPLANPGVLPLEALDRQALAVLSPLAWKNTPPFISKDHRKERDVTTRLMGDGSIQCSVDLTGYGSSDLSLRQFFRKTTSESRRALVLRGLAKRYPGVTLNDYQTGDYMDLSQPLNIHYSFTVPRYAEPIPKQGWKVYPVVFDDVEEFLASLGENRFNPLVVPQNFNSITQEVINLPAGFTWDEPPKGITYTNTVADLTNDSKLQFGALSFNRDLGLKQRVISPGKDYEELQAFYQVLLTQDRTPFKAFSSR